MNFFYLDEDPFKSIEYHCDKLQEVTRLKGGNTQTER